MNDFVEARFEKLRNNSNGDWNDVLQRVRRRGRRRRLAVVGAVVLAVIVVVPSALALRTTITDFFQSDPAPANLTLEFERQDVGAPPGLENRVTYGETRKIFERKLADERTLTLWVAPNRRGGFCMALDGPGHPGGFGCLWQDRAAVSPTIEAAALTRDGDITRGPFLVWGTVGMKAAETIELQYQDGAIESQPLTWVSKPIDASFFLFEIGRVHWKRGNQYERLIVRDGEGGELRSELLSQFPLGPP
jgi:hypothetical protein